MTLIDVRDASIWEAFMIRHPWTPFTQSWVWGEFREALGSPIRRFALVDENGKWCAAAAMEYRPKRFVGGYWFAPRGPVFSSHLSLDEVRTTFTTFLELLSKEKLQRALFWRFEPPVELGHPEGLIPLRMRRTDAMNPSSTILLDLKPSQDELLANMHQKTRYHIRLAGKHGVTTRIASQPADVGAFLKLMDETALRDGFVQRDHQHILKTYKILQPQGMARIRLAEKDKQVLAANLEILYGDTVTYLYGSSSSALRELKAPFALHWDAIVQAQRDGFRWYDFWGANPESKAAFSYKDSWEGITRFKRGWGGRQVDLYGTWDLPFVMSLYHLAFPKHFLRG